MSDIVLRPTTRADRPILDSLMQLYIHDFSEHWAGTARGELEADGKFEPYPFEDFGYWRDPDRHAFLVEREGRPIGFVLVNAHSHTGLPMDRAIAEFFIVRKHRRTGAGQAAAHAALVMQPGRWEATLTRRAQNEKGAAGCPAAPSSKDEGSSGTLSTAGAGSCRRCAGPTGCYPASPTAAAYRTPPGWSSRR